MKDGMLVLDLMALGCGIFSAYTWIRLKITKTLFDNELLIPAKMRIAQCEDPQAYIQSMSPWILVIAITTLLYGAMSMANDCLALFPAVIEYLLAAVTGAVVIAYCMAMKRFSARFWR